MNSRMPAELMVDERALYETVVERLADYIAELRQRCASLTTAAAGNDALESQAVMTYDAACSMVQWAEISRKNFGKQPTTDYASELLAPKPVAAAAWELMPISPTRH